MSRHLTYGGVPVPFTVSWTGEEQSYRVDHCRWAPGPALCQATAPGEGKPRFGKPHPQRQRQAITDGLCDLCARPLKLSTKVSLSRAKIYSHGVDGPAILQFEPLLHRACALISMRHCPALKEDIELGLLAIRQVTRSRVQYAVMDEEYVETITGRRLRAIGHAKVELLTWADRDAAWLEAA